jgi:SpoVK/Ycf46/Vps4 family AAA+-type ATPase
MMAESLTDPTIIPFLMEYKNSILIIEDAEKVLGTRENSNNMSQSTSNLLNLTDGILGDCLNIQIVATFNTKRDNIDDAFMRKGRLIAEHKFTKLSIEESNKLLESLSKDVITEEEMALSDIYNIDVDIYKTIKQKGKIGF